MNTLSKGDKGKGGKINMGSIQNVNIIKHNVNVTAVNNWMNKLFITIQLLWITILTLVKNIFEEFSMYR